MPDYFETDPVGSERLLGKVMTGGNKIKRRRQMIGRGFVAGFVALVAAGTAVGATQLGHGASAPAATTTTTTAPAPGRGGYVLLHPARAVASSFVPGHPPGDAVDRDTRTFWAVGTRIPLTVRVPYHYLKTVIGPGGVKHRVQVDSFYTRHELSAPGVGAWIRLVYSSPHNVVAVSFLNGDQYPTRDFSRAVRPANVEVIFSLGAPQYLTIGNIPEFQHFTIAPRRTTFVEVKILSVFPGTSLPFAAITDLGGYTWGKPS